MKNQSPLPLIKRIIVKLSMSCDHIQLVINIPYYMIRIVEVAQQRIAVRTHYRIFEYLIIAFGLANAPRFYEKFLNDILLTFLNIFYSALLPDIIIYSHTLINHN
jgi:hypothetical protein